ncbi:MAG: PEGA domain-containing protein, partial [Dolichospermum sp.]
MLSLSLCLLLSSCASIIHGPTQSVSFSSQPSGAKISIDGKDYGATPKTVDLRRKGRLKGEIGTKKEYAVKIELDGFYPYEVKLQRDMDGWFLGNILFGGLIGI